MTEEEEKTHARTHTCTPAHTHKQTHTHTHTHTHTLTLTLTLILPIAYAMIANAGKFKFKGEHERRTWHVVSGLLVHETGVHRHREEDQERAVAVECYSQLVSSRDDLGNSQVSSQVVTPRSARSVDTTSRHLFFGP